MKQQRLRVLSRAFRHARHHAEMGKPRHGSFNSLFGLLLILILLSALVTWHLFNYTKMVTSSDFEAIGDNEAKIIARSRKVLSIKEFKLVAGCIEFTWNCGRL